ncbi:MAG TPA: DUF6600 domain-containing protein [Verrucomicrobiae bacterium]
MNIMAKTAVVGLVCGLGLSAWTARADLEVSGSVTIRAAADFYAPLSAHGAWVEVGSYGRCWHPTGVAVEWRPYCVGHWVWTDCGWYWASDEPWGWACYHYGTWVYDPVYAWVWVPGIEWGPAWVSWRVGGGYVGWAPLPPPGVRIDGPRFVFVEKMRFTEPLRAGVVVVNNENVLNRTTAVNNLKRETRNIGGGVHEKVVVNEGPGLAALDKTAASKVRVVAIQEAARQARAPERISPSGHGAPAKEQTGVGSKEHARPAPAPGVAPSETVGPGTRPTPDGRNHAAPKGSGHGNERQHRGKDHGKDNS